MEKKIEQKMPPIKVERGVVAIVVKFPHIRMKKREVGDLDKEWGGGMGRLYFVTSHPFLSGQVFIGRWRREGKSGCV
jgi:hypothetical protein